MPLACSILSLVFLGACGGRVEAVDGGFDSESDDVIVAPIDATPVSDAAPPCNVLEPVGKPVTITQVAEDAPPFAGSGTMPFALGLYELESSTIYTGPGGISGTTNSVDAVARISSAKTGFIFQAASATDNEAPLYTSSTAIPTASGALSFTQFCPTAEPSEQASYAFDGTTLSFRVIVAGSGTVDEKLLFIGQ